MTQNVSLAPALAAYAKAAERIGGAEEAPAEATAANFAAVLDQTLSNAVEAGQQGEALARQALTGQAGLQEVIEAVNAAELSLQTVVAVRDRVISAYQEIMRMPI